MKEGLANQVEKKLPLIEKTLKEILHSFLHDAENPLLFEAASYSLLNPGKRLRPLLVLAAVESLGGPLEAALYPACAIEILHTYSLIHDDLPCMDDDDLRRGKPTLHKIYPEGQAVLTGDVLLTLAFEVLASAPGLLPHTALELIKILSEKAGGKGMILGQSLDLLGENKTLSWKELSLIHKKKTADLIGACLEFGAVLSDRSSLRPALRKIGENIGLSFQIVDDILDIEGDPVLLGKPSFSDVENNKSTSVSLLGIEPAKSLAEQLLSEALQTCTEIEIQHSFLVELLPKLVYRNF